MNYEGLWWAAGGAESGWGINLAHQEDVIFATWFTYNVSGRAWWLTMTANRISNGEYSGQLFRTTGAPFSAYVPPATPIANRHAELHRRDDRDVCLHGERRRERSHSDQGDRAAHLRAGPTCVWGAQPDLTLATNYQDLWWASGGSEPAGV